MITAVLKCKKHPAYQAKREPKTKVPCAACRLMWMLVNENQVPDLVFERED